VVPVLSETNKLIPSYIGSSLYDAANLFESEVAKNISEKVTAARQRRIVNSVYKTKSRQP
jgi:hypothetical protein